MYKHLSELQYQNTKTIALRKPKLYELVETLDRYAGNTSSLIEQLYGDVKNTLNDLVYFSKRARLKKKQKRQEKFQKKRQQKEQRMKNPSGGSKYAKKQRLKEVYGKDYKKYL